MLKDRILVLDFDGSVTAQAGLLGAHEHTVMDMRDLAGRVRFWMGRRGAEELEKRLPSETRGVVTFLGSGDFHHITSLLLKRYDEPISVIDFDLHTDWDTALPVLHCGSWVAHAVKDQDIRKIIMAGVFAERSSVFSLQTGDLASLKDDRIELYPYLSGARSVFLRDVPQSISFNRKRRGLFTNLSWQGLRDKDIGEFFFNVIRRLPTKKVYVTIDKDCLAADHALTNWDQGAMPLESLLTMLKLIKENLDIVGMDITGDYSPAVMDGFFKRTISRLGHPKTVKAQTMDPSSITEVNERTNLKILYLLLRQALP